MVSVFLIILLFCLCLFKVTFDTKTNLNMQISMVVSILSVLECLSNFAEVIECLLMFLLNMLLDVTDEFDVFRRSFVTQNTSTFLYTVLTYETRFRPHHLRY